MKDTKSKKEMLNRLQADMVPLTKEQLEQLAGGQVPVDGYTAHYICKHLNGQAYISCVGKAKYLTEEGCWPPSMCD